MLTSSPPVWRWLLKKVDLPENLPNLYAEAVDYGLCNDLAVRENDSLIREADEAAQRLSDQPSEAVPELLRLAHMGSVWAMLNVGHCLLNGIGTPVDHREAERWYGRASQAGSQHGMLALGFLLEERGEQERAEAVYKAGAEQNWAPALWRLAKLKLGQDQTKRSINEVRPMLERAATSGSVSAALFLGRSMARGRFGWPEIVPGLLRTLKLSREISEDAFAWAKQQGLAS